MLGGASADVNADPRAGKPGFAFSPRLCRDRAVGRKLAPGHDNCKAGRRAVHAGISLILRVEAGCHFALIFQCFYLYRP